MQATTAAEAAQARLLAALADPKDKGPVRIAPLERAGAALRRGVVFDRAGRRIGGIENFQLDFVRYGADAPALDGEPKEAEPVAQWRRIGHDDVRIRFHAPKIALDDPALIVIDQPGPALSFTAAGEIELLLYAHPWSGEIEAAHPGGSQRLDLYSDDHCVPRPLRLDLGPAPVEVEVALTGAGHPAARGRQCVFGGFRETTGRLVPPRHEKTASGRAAAFTPAFHELLARTPQDGLLLDIGGGARQFDDARYINLDYAAYAEPDLIADATRLPLRDASIDAVYSSGVFEHIAEPARAGAEAARVLKPGGRAVIGWAFLQPIHAEGQHFYNATPWGLEQAFAGLKLRRLWCDTSFAFLVRWGAEVSGLTGLVPAAELEQVCATLSRWDALIPESHKPYMANGVWGEFEKL